MPRQATRRTADRILQTALEQFNRFGESQVSTPAIAAAMGISAGNLHYHYRSKDALVNDLFDRYAQGLQRLLPAAADVRDVEHAWFFLHSLFELLWEYRFLYRDVNHLLSRNRKLETEFDQRMQDTTDALRALLEGLRQGEAIRIDAPEIGTTATSMTVVLTWWLSYEYVRDPRHALESEGAGRAMLRGSHHVLHLLVPYLEPAQRRHLMALAGAYEAPAA